MGRLIVDNKTIYETDYMNLTITYQDEIYEFESPEDMDQWVEENILIISDAD